MVNFFLKTVICLFIFQLSYSQDSTLVSSVVDTTSIKVGEQFSYKIIIESDNFQEINFPETFNFSPFTVADQFPTDTNYLKSKKIISKKFNLTHFDEGSYAISPQKLSIGKEIYTTEKIDIDGFGDHCILKSISKLSSRDMPIERGGPSGMLCRGFVFAYF